MTLADNEADLVFLLFRHDGEKGMGGGRECGNKECAIVDPCIAPKRTSHANEAAEAGCRRRRSVDGIGGTTRLSSRAPYLFPR